MVFFLYPAPGKWYIHLYNFSSCKSISNILYRYIYCNLILVNFNTAKLNLKICIRKTEAKRKKWLYTKTIEILIAHINSFFIFFQFQISIQITKILCKWHIRIFFCPGCCKLSAWNSFSKKDPCNRTSPLLSKLGNIEDTFYPLRFFQNICKLHRTTGIYKQNNRHTSAV